MSDGQIVGTVVGAVIGFVGSGFNPAGAVKGAYWGYTAGSMIDPPPGPHTEGPRLNDRAVQVSEEGAPLPEVFGTVRLAGNVIWSSGLEEIATEDEQGGGSGGGGATMTSYSYRTDAAIALCAGEIAGIRRIWADTKLIYDNSDTASIPTLLASSARFADLRVYTGSETQTADPLIQAIEGAANTPAFRGIAYVVLEDMELADFGNRLPNFSFEVVNTGTPGAFAYDSKCDDLQQGDGHRISCGYADADGLWVWRISSEWLTSAEVHVYLYLIPFGSTQSQLVKSYPVTLPSSAPGYTPSMTHLVHGQADRPCIAIPFVASPNEGLVLIFEDGTQYTVSAPLTVGYGAYAFALVGNVCFWVQGYDANYKLWRHVLGAASGTQIVMPWAVSNTTYRLAVDASRLIVPVQKLSPSEPRLLQFNTETGALEKDVLASGEKAWLNSGLTLTDGAIDFVYHTGPGYWYKLTELDGTSILQSVLPSTPNTWVSQSPIYDWCLFDRGQVQGIWYSYYNVTARAGWFTSGRFSQAGANLQSVCESLCASAGLSAGQYDMSALSADTVRGYTLSRPMAMRAALEPLQTAYAWDAVEVDGKLKAVKRGGAVAATLGENDLGAAEQPGSVTLDLTRNNAIELPSEVQVSYSDLDNDYQAGTQYARSLTAAHTNISQVSLPLVMTSQEAARLADTLLQNARYAGRFSLSFACTYAQARLVPADVVSLPGAGVTWRARIVQVDLGMPGLVNVQAVPELVTLYTSPAAGSEATIPAQEIIAGGLSKLMLLDCCLLRDADNEPGWYATMAGYATAWPGGLVYKSNDAGATWAQALAFHSSQFATQGQAKTVLPTADCRVWDKANTLNVALLGGKTLSSTTEANLLNGANSALLGAPGRWELIQFLNATLEADGSYTLRDLLRGRKGTEHAAASHAIYDGFVLLSTTTMQEMDVTAAEIGAERQIKYLTAGDALEAAAATGYTYTGERLKPLAPVLIGGARNPDGTYAVKWARRDRIDGDWHDYHDVPMSEAVEAYTLDIYDTAFSQYILTTTSSSQSATIIGQTIPTPECVFTFSSGAQSATLQSYPDVPFRFIGTDLVGCIKSTILKIDAYKINSSGTTYTKSIADWITHTLNSAAFSIKTGVTYYSGGVHSAGWEIDVDVAEPSSVLTSSDVAIQAIRDHRDSPTNIFLLSGRSARLVYASAGATGGLKSLGRIESSVHVLDVANITDANPLTTTRYAVYDFYAGESTQLDSAATNNWALPTVTNYPAAGFGVSARDPIYGVAFGSLLYVISIGPDSTWGTSGKTLDITNILNAHLAGVAATMAFRTRRYTISGSTLTQLDDRKGLARADRINATQGIEWLDNTMAVINAGTGSVVSSVSMGYPVACVAGDWVVGNVFYSLDLNGTLRKHSSAGTVLASYALGISVTGLQEAIYVSSDYVYVLISGGSTWYRGDKSLSTVHVIDTTGEFTINAPGEVYPASQGGVSYATNTLYARPDSANLLFVPAVKETGGVNYTVTVTPTAPLFTDDTNVVGLPSAGIGVRVAQISAITGPGHYGQGVIT